MTPGGMGREEGGVRDRLPGLRPSRAISMRDPDPVRGPWGRASMVFVDGEGVPSPAPPPDDISHGPVHGEMPAENKIGAGTPEAITCTAPPTYGWVRNARSRGYDGEDRKDQTVAEKSGSDCGRYGTVQSVDSKNVGSVRFELTIDGSLRHASVLQRVIISQSGDPLFITCKDRWSPSPFRAWPRPRSLYS